METKQAKEKDWLDRVIVASDQLTLTNRGILTMCLPILERLAEDYFPDTQGVTGEYTYKWFDWLKDRIKEKKEEMNDQKEGNANND